MLRHLVRHWEALVTAVLFLVSVYGAVYLVRTGQLGWAGMASCCAFGFFQALDAFNTATAWRDLVRRQHQGDAHRDS